MAYSLTIGGYEFDNPPEKYRKHLTLGNTPVPHYRKGLAQFYQSGQQELQFEVEGRLSLNEQNDLEELEDLQEIAIQGGEVDVDFDPFFSGECIIEDDPFRQADELGYYRFILTVNSVFTDDTAYPSHATPTTGNTFKLGSFDFGYDPESVEENYERQTNTVDRLQGISQSVDNAGLVTKVTIDGNTDGAGQTALWDKARSNELSYLDAEFQKGWALIADLSVRNNENAPDYLKGLFQYSLDLLIVSNPEGGIGKVSSFIDHDVKNTGTYVSDGDSGDADFSGLEYTVSGGSGSLNDAYVEWSTTTLTLSDDATNYVYVTDDDGDGSGDVKYNNSGFPADSISLYRVYTSGGVITKIEDLRSLLIQDNDADAGDFSSYKDNGDLYGTVATGTSPDSPNNKETTWPTVTNLLSYNATNYLYLEDPDADGTGTISVNQSAYPADTVHMWRIETDGSGITNRIDDRLGDLTTGGSGDTSDSDLVFSDDMVIDDSAFDFARVLALSDSLDVGDAGTLPWLGLSTFDPETITDVDDSGLSPKGIAALSESVPLDDGGSATGGGGGSTETVPWETATDWNSAVSQYGVVHDSFGDLPGDGTIKKGYPAADEFGGSALLAYYPHDESSGAVTDATGNWGDGTVTGAAYDAAGIIDTSELSFDGVDDYVQVSQPSDLPTGADPFTLSVWFNLDGLSNPNGQENMNFITWGNDSTDNKNAFRTHSVNNTGDANGYKHYFWSNDLTIEVGLSTGTWYHAVVTYDGSTRIIYHNGSQVASDTAGSVSVNGTDVYFGIRGTTKAGPFYGALGEIRIYNRALSGAEVTELYESATGPGTLTTGTKTFSEPVKPDLTGLTYSLNGHSITLDVIGSPGTSDEETVSVTLDGASSYTLSWGSSHTDFRLKVELNAPRTDTPTFSGGDLEAETGGADSDQNPNTHWTVRGGQYDTSGNEYEGGGITTKYEG